MLIVVTISDAGHRQAPVKTVLGKSLMAAIGPHDVATAGVQGRVRAAGPDRPLELWEQRTLFLRYKVGERAYQTYQKHNFGM